MSFATCLVLAFISLAAPDTDWHQWRGPGRDGVARNAQFRQDWPKVAPPPLWRVAIGEGYSAPVISKGRLCIMGRQGDQEVCMCLDSATGKELWRYAYEQPFQTHPGARSAGLGPKATPTIDGDRVYMLGINGRFHCFDLQSGRLHWSLDFAKDFWGVEKDNEGYDKWKPFCGLAASPLIDGDRVIVPVGGKKAGAIAAFDKFTGKLIWKCLDDRSSYASPMLVNLAGVKQVVGFTGIRMIGANAADGKLLWEYPIEIAYEDTIVTPIVRGDMVLVCGWDKPATALRITGKDGQFQSTVAWQNRSLRTMVASPVLVGDHLYGFSDTARILCIDMANGKTVWTSDVVGKFASLVVAEQKLICMNEVGELHVLDLTPRDFARRAKYTLSEHGDTWAHPAVSGSRVYIKDKQHLMCYEFGQAP